MPSVSDIYFFSHEAEESSAGQPPIILIHGAGGNHLSWPPQIRRLPGQRIYALDLPGHGKSSGVGRHSIDDYAEDLSTFMKLLKIRKAILVGISMGSGIALAFAIKHPKNVSGLVLLGSGAKLRVASTILESLGNPNSVRPAVEMINDSCFGKHVPERLKELSKQTMIQMRPSALLGDFLACNQFDVSGRLDEIKIRTLIVCGSEDRMTPMRFSEHLHASIAGSKLRVVESAGHMVMAEQPDIVADMLLEFINRPPNGIRH